MPRSKRFSTLVLVLVVVVVGTLAFRTTAPSQATASKGPRCGVVVRADDFPSLQAAIDAVPVEGGMVLLSPRRYVIDQPLRIRHEDLLLQGSGPASVIEKHNRQGAPALVIEPPAGFVSKTGQKERLWRVELSGLRLEGNPNSGHGVVVENTYGSIISSNMIEECQGWAVVLDRDCYGIAVSANVLAHQFTGGVDLRDAHDLTITGNTFSGQMPKTLAVRGRCPRVVFTGNIATGTPSDHRLLQQSALQGNIFQQE